jgi:hypothetical protein
VTSPLHYAHRFNGDLALARVHSDARRIVESEGLIEELGKDHVLRHGPPASRSGVRGVRAYLRQVNE